MKKFFIKRNLSPRRAKWRLAFFLLLFGIILCLPTLLFALNAYRTFELENYMGLQEDAYRLFERMDGNIVGRLLVEENRRFEEYNFFDVETGRLSDSPLNKFPLEETVPGLIGYFQIDPKGNFHTPILPKGELNRQDLVAYGIDDQNFEERVQRSTELLSILKDSKIIRDSLDIKVNPSFTVAVKNDIQINGNLPLQLEQINRGRGRSRRRGEVQKEIAQLPQQQLQWDDSSKLNITELYDNSSNRLYENKNKSSRSYNFFRNSKPRSSSITVQNIGTLDELEDPLYISSSSENLQIQREDQTSLTESSQSDAMVYYPLLNQEEEYEEDEKNIQSADQQEQSPSLDFDISKVLGEIAPFQFDILDSGEWIFYRQIFHQKQRFLQGFLVHSDRFVEETLQGPFNDSLLKSLSGLMLKHKDKFTRISGLFSPPNAKNYELYRNELSTPMNDIELIWSLPGKPSASENFYLDILMAVFLGILAIGLLGIWKLGSGQIELAQQRNDFVSSVSHELKTPLTSIRMYGEMLRSDWCAEEKKKSYYDFIYFESERLTRLINNVLRLSRIGQGNDHLELKPYTTGRLIDLVQSKVSAQIENSGFELKIQEEPHEATLLADEDAFVQIFINLVDNAIKFSSDAEIKKIEIGSKKIGDQVRFYVRDYGPGIPRSEKNKIFKLFERLENELTRKTTGTGIGLALVKELAKEMHARIGLMNQSPGVLFWVEFKIQE